MHVPETAVNKDDRAPLGHNDVWLTGQVFGMKGVSETSCMKCFANENFWFRIL